VIASNPGGDLTVFDQRWLNRSADRARGGRTRRLEFLFSKPAVSFAGKYRLIDIPLSNCINSDIKRIYVLTQFQSASLHRHIMQTYMFDVFTDGFVDILAAEQTTQRDDWFQGTSDAVRATLNHTMYYGSRQMLILSGDHLYRMNYSDLIRFHRESKADISICVYPVPKIEASRMGLLKADSNGCVSEFVEKPQDPQVINSYGAPPELFSARGLEVGDDLCLASMGRYVFEPEVLKDVLADESMTDFGKEVIPAAIDKYKVMAYPFNDYWVDIGTIGSFYEANVSLAQTDPPYQIYLAGWPTFTRTRSLPPSRIIGSQIRDSLVVEGSDIQGAEICDSIVGMRSNDRDGTVLDGVVMLGSDFYEGEQLLGGQRPATGFAPALGIGRNCRIERAIIDKNVRIGDDVVIRSAAGADDYQGERRWIRDGITILPKGTVIPPGAEL